MICCSSNFTYAIGTIKASVEVYCTSFAICSGSIFIFLNKTNTTQRSTTSISSQYAAKSDHFIFSYSTGTN